MTTQIPLPHKSLLAHGHVLGVTRWATSTGLLDEHLEWQLGLDVQVEFEMNPDLEAIADILGYDPSHLDVVAEWRSSTTRLREVAWRGPLSAQLHAEVTLPGDRIGGEVTLRRCVVTRRPIESDDPFVPDVSGAIIWFDEHRVDVEGVGSQFAVYFLDFEAAGLAGGATWSVEAPDSSDVTEVEFAEPASESVSVRLNAASTELAGKIAEAPRSDPVATIARAQITCEIAVHMVELARQPSFSWKWASTSANVDDLHEGFYEAGTLGDMVAMTLRTIGVGSKEELDERGPDELRADIQARFLEWPPL